MAHVLKILGCESLSMVIRFDKVLRTFDTLIQDSVMEQYEDDGIKFYKNSLVTKIEPVEPFYLTSTGRETPTAVKVHIYDKASKSTSIVEVEKVFFAVGRYGNTKSLNLDKVGVELGKNDCIKVDMFQNTTAPNIYSVGDSCGEPMLAPGMYLGLSSLY